VRPRCISSQGRPHDEIIVECDEDDADAVMAEVQAIMETRSVQVFIGQKIGSKHTLKIIGAV
jgi:hypothetical protein